MAKHTEKINTDPYDAEKTGKIFNEYLTRQGLRKTPERKTILDHICQIQGPFDIDTLYERMEENNFHVSKASVYDTIELLMNACLIVRHQFSKQTVRYELRSVASGHFHVICCYCGAIKEVKSDKIMRFMKDLKIAKFSQEYCSMYVYGMCSKCKYRLPEQNKKTAKEQT
ncbi:MAG: transcriptional repressor [Tannerella sp.]|jgi:Fur family ferric uptake transcriptional regulator|nr:transcriptional repressor [Tannerella sp.]